MKLAIIDYGAGNICSILFALQRLGCEALLTNDIDKIIKSDKIIFPGVGEASSANEKLLETGLHKLIPNLKQPVLGICLGMQLMCNYTEEGDTKGLGIFDVTVKRFSSEVRVPQIGWNTVYDLKSRLFEGVMEKTYMYLAHSFYASLSIYTIATIDYEEPYSGALHRNNFYGVQFHPEKSGELGARVLENFIKI